MIFSYGGDRRKLHENERIHENRRWGDCGFHRAGFCICQNHPHIHIHKDQDTHPHTPSVICTKKQLIQTEYIVYVNKIVNKRQPPDAPLILYLHPLIRTRCCQSRTKCLTCILYCDLYAFRYTNLIFMAKSLL